MRWVLFFLMSCVLLACPEISPPLDGEPAEEEDIEVECELEVLFGDFLYTLDFDYQSRLWFAGVELLSSIPPSEDDTWQGMTFVVILMGISDDGQTAFFEIKESFSDAVVTCGDEVPDGWDQPPLLFDGERRN